MNQHLDDTKILIIGQSHFEEGIIPDCIRKDSIFNFAISGQGLIWTEQLAQRYIPKMKNLKIVLVPFSYGGGYKYYGRPSEFLSTYRCMYYKYMHLHYDPLTDWLYWPEIFNSKLDIFDRLITHKDGCMGGITFSELDSLKGFIPLSSKNKPEGWETGHLPSSEIDFSQKNEDYFFQMNSIARLCQERNIRLVMISIPWWKSAHEKMTKEGISKMQIVVEELMNNYPCIEYHNYVFDKRFTADDFNDATHLNELGASKFSEILKDDLVNH